MSGKWSIKLGDELEAEFKSFPEIVQKELMKKMILLEKFGPDLGRPHADSLIGSKHSNMKELRFDADGGVWRAAFAFDRTRQAIVLVAGDKRGANKRRFYKVLISRADRRFSAHLAKASKVKTAGIQS